jgi:hypothetical protein
MSRRASAHGGLLFSRGTLARIEIALVFAHLDHIACFIVNANHSHWM